MFLQKIMKNLHRNTQIHNNIPIPILIMFTNREIMSKYNEINKLMRQITLFKRIFQCIMENVSYFLFYFDMGV